MFTASRSLILRALPLLVLVSAALQAQQTLLIDNPAGGNGQNLNTISLTQTMTLPAAGDLLRCEVRIFGGAGLTLNYDLCSTTPSGTDPAGEPVIGSPLYSGSVVLPAGSGYRWVELDLVPASHSVQSGEFIAIRIGDVPQIASISGGNSYSGGALWTDSGGNNLGLYNGRDLSFRLYSRNATVSDDQEYCEDFEGGPGGWLVGNGVWEWGTPQQTHINQAWSGSKCWMTDLDADYPNSAMTAVTSGWFDCSGSTVDPYVEAAIIYRTQAWNDGMRIECDLDDGLGWRTVGDSSFYNIGENALSNAGLSGLFWGGFLDPQWRIVRHVVEGAAGRSRVRLRFLFGSDAAYRLEGVAVDDVRLRAPKIRVTPGAPHFDSYEDSTSGFVSEYTSTYFQSNANAAVWERGSPQTLGSARTGAACWATVLDGPYPSNVIATLSSPPCDFSALTSDPVLEFALLHDFNEGDGMRVEVNLGTGLGFQPLGSAADWYDGTLSSSNGAGGAGWTGTSTDWRVLRHRLDGVAGLDGVRFRFLFSSDLGHVSHGALLDDLRIYEPAFPGSASLAADGLGMEVFVDGSRQVGSGDALAVSSGEQIELYSFASPGDLATDDFLLAAEVFATGSTTTNVYPDVWLSLGSSTWFLMQGPQAPFGFPLVLGTQGQRFGFVYPGGVGGTSMRAQAFVISGNAANGIYASSDAFELQFQ